MEEDAIESGAGADDRSTRSGSNSSLSSSDHGSVSSDDSDIVAVGVLLFLIPLVLIDAISR